MTALIQQSSGAELYELISSNPTDTLTEEGLEIMYKTLQASATVWLGSADGKVLGFCGLVPPTLISNRAYLWLYTTKHLEEHVFMFVRHSQKVVEQVLQEYPIVVGHCVIGNDKAVRWLRWLGAEFDEPIDNRLLPFTIKAK